MRLLKNKRGLKIRLLGCADDQFQIQYKTKYYFSAPTVSIKYLIMSCDMDASEG